MQGAGGAQAYGMYVQASNPRSQVRSGGVARSRLRLLCAVLCQDGMGYCLVDYGATPHGVQDRTRDGSYHGMNSESQDIDRPALPFDIRWSDYRHRYRVVLPADSRRYDDTIPCPEGVRDLTSGQ
jgi:hypothetical protein